MLFRLTGVLFFSCQSVTKRRIRHLEVSRRNKLHGEVQNGGKETEKEKKKKRNEKGSIQKAVFEGQLLYKPRSQQTHLLFCNKNFTGSFFDFLRHHQLARTGNKIWINRTSALFTKYSIYQLLTQN